MADTDTTSGVFSLNISTPSPQKRKRRSDHLDDEGFFYASTRDAKRRPTSTHHCLPFRLSPGRPSHVSVPPVAFSHYTSIYQQPPTPVDTSDDESLGQQAKDDDPWTTTKPDSQHGSDSSVSSTKVQCADSDVDMDLTVPLAAQPPKIRRARSNDIIPPERDTNFLAVMDKFARERVPTPISSHFDSRVDELPNAPRHQFPPLRTNLSPMIEQESWISRDGLPSPVDDEDMDMMMMDRDGPSGIGSGDDDPHMRSGKYGLDGNSSPSGRARTGRLHMGYLNDCEKCIQKVPGHYSHIIWT